MAPLSTEAQKEYDALRYQRIKEERKAQIKKRCDEHQSKLREIKLENGCAHCGTKEDVSKLQFHHVDRSSKEFNISTAHSYSWKKIEEEMAKCIILCQECHINEHKST